MCACVYVWKGSFERISRGNIKHQIATYCTSYSPYMCKRGPWLNHLVFRLLSKWSCHDNWHKEQHRMTQVELTRRISRQTPYITHTTSYPATYKLSSHRQGLSSHRQAIQPQTSYPATDKLSSHRQAIQPQTSYPAIDKLSSQVMEQLSFLYCGIKAVYTNSPSPDLTKTSHKQQA